MSARRTIRAPRGCRVSQRLDNGASCAGLAKPGDQLLTRKGAFRVAVVLRHTLTNDAAVPVGHGEFRRLHAVPQVHGKCDAVLWREFREGLFFELCPGHWSSLRAQRRRSRPSRTRFLGSDEPQGKAGGAEKTTLFGERSQKVSFSRPALPYPSAARLELELRSGEPGRITGFLGRTTGELGRHIVASDPFTGGPGVIKGASRLDTANLAGTSGEPARDTALVARTTRELIRITGGLSGNTSELQETNAPQIPILESAIPGKPSYAACSRNSTFTASYGKTIPPPSARSSTPA